MDHEVAFGRDLEIVIAFVVGGARIEEKARGIGLRVQRARNRRERQQFAVGGRVT